MWKAYVVAVASLLAGATFVHQLYKPDLVSSSCMIPSACSFPGLTLATLT